MPKREYPYGRMGADDDGSVAIGVVGDKKHGRIVIEFGRPVHWIGLRPEDNEQLIRSLVLAQASLGKPVTLHIGKRAAS